MRLFLIFLSVALFPPLPTKSIAVLATIELVSNFFEILETLTKAVEAINNHANLVEQQEEVVFTKLDNINLQLEALDQQIFGLNRDVGTIIKLLNNLPQVIRLELNLHNIRNYQTFLDTYFDEMKRFVRDFDEYENATLLDFGSNVVSSHPNSVHFLIEAIYRQVTRADFLNVFQRQFGPQGNLFCTERQSQQQASFKFLFEVLLTNFKSFLLEQTAYTIKKLYRLGNYIREINGSRNQYIIRHNNIIKSFEKHIQKSSTEFWRCDPDQHKKDKTYVEITNFLHGFLLNKVNIDPRGECKNECSEYKFIKKQNCRDNNWCKRQTSCPHIVECSYLDSKMDVCLDIMSKTGRRYKYIELEDGTTLGKRQTCTNPNKYSLSTYIYWLVWKCSYCFCICDEGPKKFSDRYINLRLSMANIRKNRVVTGLRFVKHNQIIHLQIQEGKLLKGGQIDPVTVRWVPPENYTILDRHISEGQDYHTLSWSERTLELSEIKAPEGHVVTGVRFRRFGPTLDLEVMVTPFNFSTGRLQTNPEIWSTFQDSLNLPFRHKFKREVVLSSPDIPTRSNLQSQDYTTGKYVKFTTTDKYKDAAQTTVPFFDAQHVSTKVPQALSGVGLYHKGRKGSGGFIAPKIFTYDVSQHLDLLLLDKNNLRNSSILIR